MSAEYVRAVEHLGWLMLQVEDVLTHCADGKAVDSTFVQRCAGSRLPSSDENAATISALGSIDVLKRRKGRLYRLNKAKLVETAEYRRGVQEAIKLRTSKGYEQNLLLASIPYGLSLTAAQEVRTYAANLRASIVTLIMSAQQKLILASPFWDLDTIDELSTLLLRRLDAGVEVEILGRFGEYDTALERLTSLLSGYSKVRISSWEVADERDPFGSQTFHFKAVVADKGERAYLGSANLTISGLRSRMELGFLLTGEQASKVARLLEIALGLSRTVTPSGAQGT